MRAGVAMGLGSFPSPPPPPSRGPPLTCAPHTTSSVWRKVRAHLGASPAVQPSEADARTCHNCGAMTKREDGAGGGAREFEACACGRGWSVGGIGGRHFAVRCRHARTHGRGATHSHGDYHWPLQPARDGGARPQDSPGPVPSRNAFVEAMRRGASADGAKSEAAKISVLFSLCLRRP